METTMNTYKDKQGRYAVEVDENPRYRRMLCAAGSGQVDIVKVGPDEFSERGFTLLPADVLGAGRFARTYSGSCLFKTARAARVIKELVMADLGGMSMAELVAEYNRITGKSVKKFETKAAGIRAIARATEPKNVEAEETEQERAAKAERAKNLQKARQDAKAYRAAQGEKVAEAANAAAEKEREANGGELPSERAMRLTAEQLSKETQMATKKQKPKRKAAAPKGNGLDRAKRVAQMTKGSGGMIIELLKKGKADDDAIVSAVLKKFPERKVNAGQVGWYRSMLVKAKVLKSA